MVAQYERLLTWVPCNLTTKAEAILETDRGDGWVAQTWTGELERVSKSRALYCMQRGPTQDGGIYDQIWLSTNCVSLLFFVAVLVAMVSQRYVTAKYSLIAEYYVLYIAIVP